MPSHLPYGASVLSCCHACAMRDEQGCSLVSLVIRPGCFPSDPTRGCESVSHTPEGCPDSPHSFEPIPRAGSGQTLWSASGSAPCLSPLSFVVLCAVAARSSCGFVSVSPSEYDC